MSNSTIGRYAGRYVGRFAPSPTGPLHLGSLIAALASYLDARAHQGEWHLRIEDVDETRCQPEHADSILRTLEACGLHWDSAVVTQSARKPRYEEAFAQLRERQRIFACVCSRREIADSAVSGIDGPVYPGTCRTAAHAEPGNALRFRVTDVAIEFHDRLQGAQSQNLARDIGDFVVRRRDGLAAYQLAVVVDDADLGVTHVVRGADLLDSTARQIALQRALGVPTPTYLHVPVLVNAEGQKLSKQTLAPPIDPQNPLPAMQQALAFLRQPVGTGAGSATELLQLAVGRWNPLLMPKTRHLSLD
jgi:glutamyl-Q tRNA(Asp) synthetase